MSQQDTMGQQQKAFWDYTPDRRLSHLPSPPTDDEIRLALARNNVKCPLNEIIVSPPNDGNFRILHRFAFSAYQRFNRSCRGCNFGIYCPPGQGKTFIVKRFAETIGIPFAFIQSPGLQDCWDLFQQVSKACEKAGVPVVPTKRDKSDFTLPPCIIFFDEAHQLRESLQRGSLLNPMEPDDGYMHIKQPGKNGDMLVVNCKEVCWVGATTDPADLFDAFRTRLSTTIEWVPATEKELPAIVKAGLDAKERKGEIAKSPPLQVCEMICKYQKVPRSAIHSFGVMVVQQKAMMPSDSWEECCKLVAHDLAIDEWGLTRKQVAILAALGQRPISLAGLGNVAKCRAEQVRSMELPGLQQYTNGGPFVISLTGRGVCITEAGLRELEKRGLPHKGKKITAEYFESKR
jgi:Holliday junction resolvasome RuvABC ATP-dependent DNA helicase subunit